MKHQWELATPDPVATRQLADALKVSQLMAQCLVNRGVVDPDGGARFLEPRLKQLADPFLLPNMRVAIDRLFKAREAGQTITIFGDYDVDGITSSVVGTERKSGSTSMANWWPRVPLPVRCDPVRPPSALGPMGKREKP